MPDALKDDRAVVIAGRIARHCEHIRMYLTAGDIERASYYADRVLCLVGKAITKEPINLVNRGSEACES